MKRAIISLAVMLTAAAAGAMLPVARVRPNIVLIVLDAFRADRIGALRNGVEVTPKLNRLAEDGQYFTNCYAPSSQTKQSMSAIFTGELPSYTGCISHARTIPIGLHTVGDRLQARGYWTAGIITNGWLLPERTKGMRGRAITDYGFHKGFHVYTRIESRPGDTRFYAAAPKVNVAARTAMTIRPDAPVLLYLHYMDAHTPRFGERARATTGIFHSSGMTRQARHAADQELHSRYMADWNILQASDHDRLAEQYDEAAHYLDFWVGRAVDYVREKLGPHTILVITADHGEHLWEHALYAHTNSLYEGAIRVPLIIVGQGIVPREVPHRVSNRNLFTWIQQLADGHAVAVTGNERIICEVRTNTQLEIRKIIEPDGTAIIVDQQLTGEVTGVASYNVVRDVEEARQLDAPASLTAAALSLQARLPRLAHHDGIKHMHTKMRWQRMLAPKSEHQPVTESLSKENLAMLEYMKALGYLN